MAVMRPPQAIGDLGREPCETTWCIELLILKNAPNEKVLTQKGSTFTLMTGKDGVCNNPMKVANGWVAYESHLRTA